MSDFSLFSLFTAGLACLVPLANAYTQPVGDSPSGNPISQPGLNSVVPVGQGFTVTWQPTTSGTVTLVLLKGPSTNAVPQYAIVEKIPNSGSYVWTPSTDLAPGQTGYGIQLIDDENGQYQYTTQFGISNPNYVSSSSVTASATTSASASASDSASASATATSSTTWSDDNGWGQGVNSWFSHSGWAAPTGGWGSSSWSSSSASASATAPANASVALNSTTVAPVTTSIVSYSMPANTSIVQPTKSLTVPASLQTSASASGSSSSGPSATRSGTGSVQTGAANTMATSFAGLVVAAGVAVFAL